MTGNGATGDALQMRQASLDDADAIRSLVREAYARWVPVIGREPTPMTADYVQRVARNRFDLLFSDAALVGLIETMTEADHLLIENVAIAPACQGRGLGRRLLAHAESLAVSSGHREIRLYTHALFAANVALYEKLGYRTWREEEFMGGICLHMSKRLNG